MKNTTFLIALIPTLLYLNACEDKVDNQIDEKQWKQGWRMFENYWKKDYKIAGIQFDSILVNNKNVNEDFIATGLKIKYELDDLKNIDQIFNSQHKKIRANICSKEWFKTKDICHKYPTEPIKNPILQKEILELYIKDQAIRGNIMHELIRKYDIDTSNLKTSYDYANQDEINIDEINRNKVKELILEDKFPTKKQIGHDAMNGIFFIIQHADGDKDWQKLQLTKIEQAVNDGELHKSKYAYLYDRIQVNNDLPQKYGTQFETVDKSNNLAILQETEDLPNLNNRRKEMNMMPIETYKRLMLRMEK